MRRWTAPIALGLSLTLAVPAQAGVIAPGGQDSTTSADLRVDVDRDGRLTARDEPGENGWSQGRGAIFLPNLDDDERRCKLQPGDLTAPGTAVDERLVACHDAADERVNGPRDVADLAPVEIRPLRGIGPAATGRLTITPADKARVHPGGELTAGQLRGGLRLGLEGRDIIRDPAKWDGRITVRLTVTDPALPGGSSVDEVVLKVAPLMLQNDLQDATKVFAGKPSDGPGWPGTPPYGEDVPGEWEPFAKSLNRAVPTTFVPGHPMWWKDMWWQDSFEPATASMPAPGGIQTMRIMIRSANLWDFPVNGQLVPTLRPLGRLLFRDLRGPDVGVVQEYTPQSRPGMDDLLNMGGNIESLPPYDGYPHGRLVYGAGARKPDARFVRMLTGQGLQPPVVIDTSWLVVGHADETTHVVRANNARGWTLAVADPRLAVRMLTKAQREGAGGQRLFTETRVKDKPAINEVLARDRAVNEEAAARIDEQLAILLAATGLRRDELVPLPVLFERHQDTGLLRAYTPGLVNGLSISAREFAAPVPHGPKVKGIDIFRRATEKALGRQGIRVHWVEAFFWAHLGGGEVHCATNAWRDTRSTNRWWTAAR
ncbi:protein-arginine deiminase family protein [Kribbella deserti]|uniref:Protein-arginine deiminase family protein n=1 Tax=Kribbella deserti TaxID=1926257 RepID=A0ABV6QJQ8_9ACTN